ncbi:elongation factor 1-gamma [Thelephora ganbajun]|uniref:Elongation factor 1-gamma n=1 Tax=Thelephora ganbajun TaxID=370292 RepID=A0ACB6Z529_THEGA|nr:elongation factor 1-gamma [Thelephora ganbajun]
MVSIGTLYLSEAAAVTPRIKAIAVLAGAKFDTPANYVHYETNKTPEFTSKFPHGKVPALETPEGFLLTESSAIARYIISRGSPNASVLLGGTPEEQALVEQWIHFADTEVNVSDVMLSGLFAHKFPYSKPFHSRHVGRIERGFNTLEKVLETKTFLVGERLTLADVHVASVFLPAANWYLDKTNIARFPSVVRFVETVLSQPHIAKFWTIQWPEKVATYAPPAKDTKKKEDKPKAAPAEKPKKEDKPKHKEPEPEEEDDLVPKEEPKAKHPLDFLPKSTFNLEDWKRAYSNKDTKGPGGAIEWFYENFDKEGFSTWRCDFKYNNELTLIFMSSNQIGGFFNRLEASRKYLFGSMGVLGEPNNSVISGVLITRGDDVKLSVDCAPDWESYEYKRLDLTNDSDKKFFEDALAWDLELDGKKWADGKSFK